MWRVFRVYKCTAMELVFFFRGPGAEKGLVQGVISSSKRGSLLSPGSTHDNPGELSTP